MLVHKKEGKEQDTPTSACFLRYSARQMGAPKTYERYRLTDLTKESGF